MTGRPYRRPYLDASVWTAALDSRDKDHDVARAILTAADGGVLQLIVSSLMELEVLGGSSDQRTEQAAQNALSALRRSSVLLVAPVPRINETARRLRLDYRLETLDAIHVATAIFARADIFLSSDLGLLKKIHGQVGVDVAQPYWLGDVPLPSNDGG